MYVQRESEKVTKSGRREKRHMEMAIEFVAESRKKCLEQ